MAEFGSRLHLSVRSDMPQQKKLEGLRFKAMVSWMPPLKSIADVLEKKQPLILADGMSGLRSGEVASSVSFHLLVSD